jgi:hypothetical protein
MLKKFSEKTAPVCLRTKMLVGLCSLLLLVTGQPALTTSSALSAHKVQMYLERFGYTRNGDGSVQLETGR